MKSVSSLSIFFVGTTIVGLGMAMEPQLRGYSTAIALRGCIFIGLVLTFLGGFVGGRKLWRRRTAVEEQGERRRCSILAILTWLGPICVLGAVVSPLALKYRKQPLTTEARTNVRRIFDWESTQVDKSAPIEKKENRRFRQLPRSLIEIPKGVCVSKDQLHPDWKAIPDFQLTTLDGDNCFRYQYEVVICPGSPQCGRIEYPPWDKQTQDEYYSVIAIVARGDLDGDGVYSYISRGSGIRKKTGEAECWTGLYTERDTE